MTTIAILRDRRGISQAMLAELAHTSQPQIARLENGLRKMTKEWAERLAPHLGVSALDLLFGDDDILAGTLPIVGRVGASTDGSISQETNDGPFGHIEAPMGASGSENAVEVSGHSMGMYAPDGSLILYHPNDTYPPEVLFGEICIIGLQDGRRLVKRLLRGSKRNHFDLESASGDIMRDEAVSWATPVAMVIQPRYARKIRIDV